jgi:hypothetical protein
MVLKSNSHKSNILTPSYVMSKFGQPDRIFFQYNIHRLNITQFKSIFPSLPDFVYCHNSIIKPLLLSLTSIADNNLSKFIKTFDGCYNVRYINHSKIFSLHSWGLAIDFNAYLCPPGNRLTINKEFASFFVENGFSWGGNFSNKFIDEMHFQLSLNTFNNYLNSLSNKVL